MWIFRGLLVLIMDDFGLRDGEGDGGSVWSVSEN